MMITMLDMMLFSGLRWRWESNAARMFLDLSLYLLPPAHSRSRFMLFGTLLSRRRWRGVGQSSKRKPPILLYYPPRHSHPMRYRCCLAHVFTRCWLFGTAGKGLKIEADGRHQS